MKVVPLCPAHSAVIVASATHIPTVSMFTENTDQLHTSHIVLTQNPQPAVSRQYIMLCGVASTVVTAVKPKARMT